MQEIHVLNIQYVEMNDMADMEFTYKPDVPKLKLHCEILVEENEDEGQGVVFLTQKQLNKLIQNKDIELRVEEDIWKLAKPLTKEQIKKVGLMDISAELLGAAGEIQFFEVHDVKE